MYDDKIYNEPKVGDAWKPDANTRVLDSNPAFGGTTYQTETANGPKTVTVGWDGKVKSIE